jgi:hypothetical protein
MEDRSQSSLEALLSFEPDLGATSAEQPLRFMIYHYYRKHFDVAQAAELAGRYIEALAAFQGSAAAGPNSSSPSTGL